MNTLTILCVLLFFVSCSNKDSGSNHSEKNSQTIIGESNEFLKIVNEHRKSKGLSPFKYSTIIQNIALSHSDDMADSKVAFGHEGFSARCAEARSQIGGTSCAENVARGQKTAKAVLTSWLNSSGHRNNIESFKLNTIGIARSLDYENTAYWTLIFLQIK